jgi:ParB-like chromosome segregation protein Spo0J
MSLKPRTWKEQQAHERDVRKGWLESLAALGVTQTEAAKMVGLDRAGLLRMCRKYGVNMETPAEIKNRAIREKAQERQEAKRIDRAAAAERDRIAKAKEDQLRSIKAEIEQRTAALIAEGFNRTQAVRAVAYQMGVQL